ncbi:2-nitropropane dioxygenase [Trametes gibbosa]|nr:2-nitropropane dioxygenase [Trametes gibbosa]
MQPVKTKLTSLLGIRVPVVSASMVYATSAELAAEVSRGGGFGFFGIASAAVTPAKLREDLSRARLGLLSDAKSQPLPIGCGFIGWMMDSQEEEYTELLDVALESGVKAIWLSFGNNLYRWIQYIRASPAYRVCSPSIFVQVTSVDEAVQAVNDWKVDVLVVQGNESGGHGRSTAPSTMVLLSEVLALLPKATAPPVLAAGGIAHGMQVAAYLTAGASGAVLGTRFLLTRESPYSAAQKSVLLAAQSHQTVRSLAFDDARGTNRWPAGIDGRGVRNRIVEDIDAGVDHATVQERFRNAAQAGGDSDSDYLLVWSGQGVSLMDEIMPAKAIVEELHVEIVQALRCAQQFLS